MELETLRKLIQQHLAGQPDYKKIIELVELYDSENKHKIDKETAQKWFSAGCNHTDNLKKNSIHTDFAYLWNLTESKK